MNYNYILELEKDINTFIIINTNKIDSINNKINDINIKFNKYKNDIQFKIFFNNIIFLIIILYLLLYR